ncbi:hypothetical protein VOLCADRAFT_118369 [Volvox carteri f. nagariensis]|uniref:Uncharacterized protein n=1 Tax=Volvox carteri f. nagariensis TaxID=3068 RepID=D8U4I8_VOLCA|nr:uncharacterized protein VOLCADRAFT_118369 [Volvox carteri f. nagariensis]EFJ45411.1 hypothetical protein VOLCADRAFT_118369 [Volvox carteri f. nagariensis]|eukprot:XP_002953438.1 hypothetical protein VOLCADRAFT_118369 [Volvox carteri f. nagariensis]
MGKSRGGKYPHKGKGSRKGPAEEDGSDEEDYEHQQRGLGGQRANVGMLPPSDSEDDEGEQPASKGEASSSQPSGQNKNAGKMPPSDSEGDEDDDSSSDDDPTPEYLRTAPTARKKEPVVEPRSEEQVRKDLDRLELIRKKREEDRLKRIADEGWDRFAPISDTNKPPGYVPSDHPSKQA